MNTGKLFFILPALLAALLTGCASTQKTPLSAHITLIPVSDKADIESGMKMDYFYGANEQALDHVTCHADQSCVYSGNTFKENKEDSAKSQFDSMVIRTTPRDTVLWARTYQIGGNYYNTLGMVPTSDGGALLYGNSLMTNNSKFPIKPSFEKIDADGMPQWGGTLNQNLTELWSAFTAGIRLSDGGYALSGSNRVGGKWYGIVLRINSTGKEVWFSAVRSRNELTLINDIIELKNGDILGVGFNKVLHDMVLFDFGPKGKVKKAPVLHIRGDEIPVGLVNLATGPAIIASETMPSGESAAIVVRLDQKLHAIRASRYRYTDGFNPYGVIALGNGKLCLYGPTKAEAERDKQSLAFTINLKMLPASALLLKGGHVFNSGTKVTSEKILFGGARPLGTKRHASSIVVTWTPSIKNDRVALKGIQRERIRLKEYANESAKQWLTTKSDVSTLHLKDMTSRLVSDSPRAKPVAPKAGKASQ